MLVRLSVIVSDEALATLVSETLSEVDVATQIQPFTGHFWEQASAPSDVLLVSLSRFPEPVDSTVRSLCDLPGSPTLVVLADSEDPELLATLLASGAKSVLNPTVDKDLWRDALTCVVERSRERIKSNGTSQSAQLDWLPEGWRDLPWTKLRHMLLSACEHEYIRHHLTETKGRIGIVAKRTGLSNRAVRLMMKRQGIKKEPFRKTKND